MLICGRNLIVKHFNVRERLIENTIRIIAENGLDKTTTKAIVSGTGINEAYIYSHFSSKDELLAAAFESLDSELVTEALRHLEQLQGDPADREARCRAYFNAMWRFFLEKKERSTAFVQYYYSPYFKKYSAESHRERYLPLVEGFQRAFREEANTWMILNHVLTTMMDFSLKVIDGALPDDEDTEEHVFRVVYHSVKIYFKGKEEEEKAV